MKKQTRNILIIEDSDDDFLTIQSRIQSSSSPFIQVRSITRARSLQEGLQHLKTQQYDVIFLDDSLSDAKGFTGLQTLKTLSESIPVIYMSNENDEQQAVEALYLGAQDYYCKKNPVSSILRMIRYASERQHIHEELEAARKNAITAVHAKSKFLAHMSHEIRTPLTSIIGFAEALSLSDLRVEERQDAIDAINSSGRHLLQIINDILDYSKIEAGALTIALQTESLVSIIEDVRRLFSGLAHEKRLAFYVVLQSDVPDKIITDALRLKQILFNLIGNAIKFTATGSVTLSVGYCPETSILTMDVIDTGIGINPDQIERLFKPFEQEDGSTTRAFGGTGLGLSISNDLAKKMKGAIQVRSVQGEGSSFSLTMEVSCPRDMQLLSSLQTETPYIEKRRADTRDLRGGTLVIADDCPFNRSLMRMLLDRHQIEYHLAEDGKQACELVKRHTPDFVLLDLHMPVMDGIEAAQVLQQSNPELPLVAMTANVDASVVEECEEAGFKRMFSKPFSQKDFYELLADYLPRSTKSSKDVDGSSYQKNPEFPKIQRQYREGLPERVRLLHEARANENYKQIREHAHKMGSASLFGYSDLATAARALEEYIKQHENVVDVKKIDALLQEIEECSNAVIKEDSQ